ncbi:hypothetical protein C8R43DRAFT_885069, partial [Mycena crocata]
MDNSSLGCAQNADGSLKDASEMEFFEDADSTVPIAGPSSSTAPKPPIHPIFTDIRPLRHVAGSRRSSPRRSSRASRPSTRVTDPNNAESS